MDRHQWQTLYESSKARRDALFARANADYSRGTDDVLSNFKRVGAMLQPVFDGPREEKYKYWAAVWGKHLDTLIGWLSGDEMSKESMQSRLDDLRVYLDIIEAMMVEDGNA